MDLAPESSLIEKENLDSSATTITLFLTTFVAVAGSFVFGSAIGYSSPVQSDLTNDLNLSVAEYSLFGSILTVGAMIGAAMSGRISDLIGRRATMGFSEMFCSLGWLVIYLSKVTIWLDAGRFLVGYGMGILSFVVPVYIAEITPKDLRGCFTTVHQLMICLGVSITYLLGSFVGWRILALIGMVPCVVQIMGLIFIPESPRWLAKVGRWEEFEIVLQRLRGESADVSNESSEIKEYTRRLSQISEGGIFDLFQEQYSKSLLVGVGLMALQQFGGVNGISFYASSIFVSAGLSSKIGMIAMVIVQIPMTTIGVILMDKSGRRPLILISAAGTFIGCLLVALSFSLQGVRTFSGGASYIALTGVLVYTGSFLLGMGGIPWVIMSEVYALFRSS
ncbi:sugar transporter ERD6-like 5 isoform X6 [Brassica rapa]|uniref:sugar transporter ERD6-like 5 isoform X6 n=1 Tax=Brassica campestris TaxID=3711 RepID=UPI00142D5123|nr:sugar transporter ERD6-like 5 isoform X6 [Brassica rapa]